MTFLANMTVAHLGLRVKSSPSSLVNVTVSLRRPYERTIVIRAEFVMYSCTIATAMGYFPLHWIIS